MSDLQLESLNSFGELLRYLRRRARLTQRELGQAVGYTDAHITRLEAGKRTPPDPATVRARFVAALGLDHDPAAANRLIALAAAERDGTPIEEAIPVAVSTAQIIRPRFTNLPAPLTHFIGREHEMADVIRLLTDTRLLTLTGSGGCGKTRLAFEVGKTSIATFPDGVWLVELAPVAEPALVANQVAATFDLPLVKRPALDVLIDHLRDKHLLLLLDNCEHLVQACAELVVALLHACPRLQLLATSREALNVPGEVTWRVPSLEADEAVRLFVDRARAFRPDFTLTAQNAATVAQVCARLDNIPLAIELAAARLRTFSIEQIAVRLGDAFRLLTAGSRTALPRHQTLRALIDWSYNLLADGERTLLRRLSVFAGGWTLEAAEALYGAEVMEPLDQLANKSLIIVDASAALTRYRMLETIRQYAHEKLIQTGEHERAHGSHLEYFAGVANTAGPLLHGAQELIWRDRLDEEIDNLRAALDWAAQTGDVQAGEILVDGLWLWWYGRGYLLEGRRWIDAVLPDDRTRSIGSPQVTAHIAAGYLAIRRGDFDQAFEHFTISTPLAYQAENDRLIAYAALGLGYMTADHEESVRLMTAVVRLCHESGLEWEAACAQLCLGIRLRNAGSRDQALGYLHAALAVLHDLGDTQMANDVLHVLGLAALDDGDDTRARALFEQAVSQAYILRDPISIADNLVELASIALQQHDHARAISALKECLLTFRNVGNLGRVSQCLWVAAGVAHSRGELRLAASLLAVAQSTRSRFGSHPGFQHRFQAGLERNLALVRSAFDPPDFDRAWAAGQQMTVEEAMAAAMAL
jgi:predicted ATPase/transcriptional regulator with XRE-family HTH domain